MRTIHKSDLPVKTCAACGRPMVWRRKWAKTWDAVRYCSERCRRTAKGSVGPAGGQAATEPRQN